MLYHAHIIIRGVWDLTNNFLSNSSKIKDVINNATSQQIVFFKRKKNGHTSNYEAFNFEFDNDNVGSKLKDIATTSIDKNENCTLKSYTIELENNSKDTIFELPSSDVHNFSKIVTALNENDVSKINVATTEDIDPNFYILNFEYNGEQVMAFTHHSPATVFKGKCFFGSQAEIYDKCLSIKTWVNCLFYRIKLKDDIIAENIVILKNSKPKFEQIFDYKDDYRNRAVNAIAQIKHLKLISNVGLFEKFIMNDEFLIKKLAKIDNENKIEKVINKFSNLKKANAKLEELKNNEGYDINVTLDEKNKCIMIPANATKYDVRVALLLLNTEIAQNLITDDILILPDNNTPVQQRLKF